MDSKELLSHWDYAVIFIYLAFMIGIGFVWSKVNKNNSDFFRGGGNMLWWLSGMSSLATGLSAYSFTAAGAKVYDTGFMLFIIYLTSVPGFFLIYFYFAAKFRQMRVVTVCDAIKMRFGRGSEQFWVWTSLILGFFRGGMALYIISLFVSAALGLDIVMSVIILALVVSIMAGTGGSWAVAASDFIQMALIIVVSLTVLIRAFALPEVGGVSGFLDNLPVEYFDFSQHERPGIWIWMLINFTLLSLLRTADLNAQGGKYLTVKDGDHAKKSTILVMFGTILLPVIAFLPVMLLPMLDHNLPEMFPHMKNPSEGAYLAVSKFVLPQGMMGLMICAIFAATMSSMDSSLNKNAGFFVKNFYCVLLRPNASEKESLWVGKVLTLVFGVIIAVAAILISQYRGADLFNFLLRINVLIGYPLVVPMVCGLLFKRTPGWSCWAAVLFSMGVAYGAQQLDPSSVASFFGFELPLNALEERDMKFIFSGTMTIGLGILFFMSTTFFYERTTTDFKTEANKLFRNMDTPIDHEVESEENQDGIQYLNMSIISMVSGGLLMLGFLIPNEMDDRLLFIWNGGAIFATGLLLYYKYKLGKYSDSIPEVSSCEVKTVSCSD